MIVLVIGLALFFATHSLSIIAPNWRQSTIDRMGVQLWRAVYSVVSVAGIVLIVWGFGLARQEPIVVWQPPTFMRHVTVMLMLFVFPLILAAYLPGRIKAMTKHPMLAAVKIWAFAHLLANGTLADILLFGGFLAWAVVARINAKRRPLTIDAVVRERPYNDVLAVVLGLALYAVFVFYLHLRLFGLSPLGLA